MSVRNPNKEPGFLNQVSTLNPEYALNPKPEIPKPLSPNQVPTLHFYRNRIGTGFEHWASNFELLRLVRRSSALGV